MIHAFTSAAPNYLGKVRTLFRSVREYHPDWMLHFLVADRQHPTLRALDLENEDYDDLTFATDLRHDNLMNPGWLFSHSLVELATAIKPIYALSLLSTDECEQVFYLDPDIVLFSAIDDAIEALRKHPVVLTPHLLRPETEPEAVLDNELCSLRHGTFNLGFLGLSNTAEAHRFTSWWRDRSLVFCRSNLEEGLFTDQKWIDLAPAFFSELCILRSPRLNVAPWNLNQRDLQGSFDQGFTVEGEPLGFYHFTGFDSGAHQAMASKYAPGNFAIQMLIEWYAFQTADLTPNASLDWSLDRYSNGLPIQPAHRIIYRQREDLQKAYPDPYSTEGRFYLDWINRTGPSEYPGFFT